MSQLLRSCLALACLVAGCQGQGHPKATFGIAVDVPAGPEQVDVAGRPLPSPSPGGGASDQPTDGATPGPAATAPPAGGGSGGGGSVVGAVAPPVFTGRVLTVAEVPIEGASVSLPDGASATTDAQGQFRFTGVHPYSPLVASHPEYATSVVTGLDAFVPLHLAPRNGQSDPITKQVSDVVGDVLWPLADLAPGAVFYQDTRHNSSVPGDLQADGSYRVRFTLDHAGPPRASLVILAADLAGTLLVGLTPPFTPLAEEPPAHVELVKADATATYAVAGVPAGLAAAGASLQVVQADGPVVDVLANPGATGTFKVPAPGALPGTMRIAVLARDADALQTSTVYLDPAAIAPTTFLTPPAPVADAATHRVTWPAVPGASGYLVQVRPLGGGALFEAWTADVAVEVPAGDWPAAGSGEVVVSAMDGAPAARQVASLAGPRQLRLDPTAGLPKGRVAVAHVKLL